MIECDTVQYVMPKLSGVEFTIAPEDKNTSVTVLDGNGTIAYYDSQRTLHAHNLPLQHEIKFSSFPYMFPDYDTNCTDTGHKIMAVSTKMKIAVRGNHYVLHAALRDEGTDNNEFLFDVQNRDDSFIFIIYKESVPLQIFTGDDTSRVVIRAIHGSPGVMGSPLAPNKNYKLLPHSCYTVNSLTDGPCTFEVEGRNRMIRIALLKENETLNAVTDVFNLLYKLCISSMKKKCLGLVVMVTGPPNVGKTSLCHFLLNKAVDKGMNPIHIDLDVRKNSNSLPGSISLSEIKSHSHISKGFEKHEQIILHFGNLNVNTNNVQFYHYLIRKMGQQLKKFLINKSKSYSVVIIDMCGPLGQDESTISCVLKSFDVSMVLVVGEQSDKSFYNYMKNSLVEDSLVATEFIPQPENIEPINEIFEIKSRDIIFRKYFYGRVRKPEELDILEIKLSEVKIYRVVSNSREDSSCNATIFNDNDFSFEPVTWGPLIEYHVLGVSKSADVREFSSAIGIEHFVCFTKIDLSKDLGFLLSPLPGPFSGKCLILGNVRMTAD